MTAIVRGAKAAGLSNVTAPNPYLPPSAENPDDVIAMLWDRVAQMQVALEGKADAGQIRSLIAYSDEDVLIAGKNVAIAGRVTFLDWLRDVNGRSTGVVDPSITIIRGGLIQTEAIIGPTWGSGAGMEIDLDNETITIGGSANPKLFASDAGIEMEGTLKAGSVIAGSVTLTGVSGTPSLSDIYDLAASGLTEGELDTLLASGVGNVIAGIGNDYTLDVNASHIIARHKDASPDGLGASYTGTLRTGLLISANGVAMGYNDKTTGNWINTIAIDGTTGAGTFSGALSAATGTFAGSLSAATGSFAGSLSAATGTFAGSLSAATGSFAGSLSAATGTFSGSLSGVDGTFDGTIIAGAIIAGSVTLSGVSGTPSLSDIYDLAASGLTEGELDTLLASGVGNVIAGISNNYILDVNASHVIARHKDANPAGLGGSYTGTLRTGLLISANGVAMGYNDKTTGNWINTIAIDGTTGAGTFSGALSAATGSFAGSLSAATGSFTGTLSGVSGTFSGTVSAGAIITNSVTVDGVTLNTIRSNAVDGHDIQQALEVSGTTTLLGVIAPENSGGIKAGTITWNATTGALTGGSGTAMTEYGLIAANAGSPTFTLVAATGAATFAGDVITGGQVLATGVTTSGSYLAAIVALGGSTTNGVIATGLALGMQGISTAGIGVHGHTGGSSGLAGVWAQNASASNPGLLVGNTSTGPAITLQSAKISGDANFLDDVDIDLTLIVGGATTLSSTLGVTGTTTLTGTLVANNTATFNSAVNVNADLTIGGNNNLLVDRSTFLCTDATGGDSSLVIGAASGATGTNTLIFVEGEAGSLVANQFHFYGQLDSVQSKTCIGVVSEATVETGDGAFAGINQYPIRINGVEYTMSIKPR